MHALITWPPADRANRPVSRESWCRVQIPRFLLFFVMFRKVPSIEDTALRSRERESRKVEAALGVNFLFDSGVEM